MRIFGFGSFLVGSALLGTMAVSFSCRAAAEQKKIETQKPVAAATSAPLAKLESYCTRTNLEALLGTKPLSDDQLFKMWSGLRQDDPKATYLTDTSQSTCRFKKVIDEIKAGQKQFCPHSSAKASMIDCFRDFVKDVGIHYATELTLVPIAGLILLKTEEEKHLIPSESLKLLTADFMIFSLEIFDPASSNLELFISKKPAATASKKVLLENERKLVRESESHLNAEIQKILNTERELPPALDPAMRKWKQTVLQSLTTRAQKAAAKQH